MSNPRPETGQPENDRRTPTLDALVFTNRFQAELPADPDPDPRPRPVQHAAYSRVQPTPSPAPSVLAVSNEMLDALGIDRAEAGTERFARIVTGTELLDGADPYAMAYGGHQFGHWAGQLGDGRAIALGEVLAATGQPLTLQLKGAGRTPFSRSADGLAVLRSSVREFLCSEAMYHLGVPTTRALSLALTGDKVVRDMFYDGHPEAEPGAVVCRVAPSFIRFGNFELPASRGDFDLVRALLDHTIEAHFPELGPPSTEAYVALFSRVVESTAQLMIDWMRVGFVHGVMNTDNLSILGLTIDYGPYGWLEDFDPNWTPNTTDAQFRRYRYGAQPQIAHWNLAQLGNALVPVIGSPEPLQQALDAYVVQYQTGYRTMMAAKLGLHAEGPDAEATDPARLEVLVEGALAALSTTEVDMTLFFRHLADVDLGATGPARREPLLEAYYQPEELTGAVATTLDAWLDALAAAVADQPGDEAARRDRMNAVNPRYVLRNYLAQLAIDAAEAGDASLIDELLDTLRRPYDDQPGRDHLAARRPEWARTRAGCSMLSCSS